MGIGAQPLSEPELRRSPAALARPALAQAGRLLGLLTVLALLGIGLAAVAAALQARRDEARRADAVVVIAPAVPSEPLVAHSFELFRRGYAPRVLLAGPGSQQLAAALQARGLPEDAIVATEGSAWEQLRAGAFGVAAPADGASAVVVAQPAELLLSLKMARDQGVRAYGSPPPGLAAEPLALVEAGLRYWSYALLRR